MEVTTGYRASLDPALSTLKAPSGLEIGQVVLALL